MTPYSDDQIRRLRDLVDRPDLSGTRYTVERRLAMGGMATVFLVHDHDLDRQLAMKILTLPDGGEDLAPRMLREAKIVAQLEHPGIVPIHDVGTLPDGRVYYTMKLVQGKTLEQEMAAPGPLQDRLRLFLRICEAVAFAHSRGVLHRDLKPSNIMIGAFGEALVMDWGVAARLSTTDGGEGGPINPAGGISTQSGTVIGTPGYLSPEQAAGDHRRIDQRSDIYGLGAVLYYILTGHAPFPGQPIVTALERAQRGEFPPPRAFNPDLPRPLEAICLKAMALDPANRYQSVNALAADIGAFLDDQPVAARPERRWEKIGRWLARNQFIVIIALVYIVIRFFFLLWRGL